MKKNHSSETLFLENPTTVFLAFSAFCVKQKSVLVLDTTYDICDMWLSDMAYQNKRLLNNQGEHPWWFGPMLLHMRKTPEIFSRFGLELIVANAQFSNLSFLGTDMEKALYKGSRLFALICETFFASNTRAIGTNRS